MKKIFVFIFSLVILSSFSYANFDEESADRFINSPSFSDLEFITDEKVKFCEEIFLEAYRRRDFTEVENSICSDFFAKKIEDELNYKKQVLFERWVY